MNKTFRQAGADALSGKTIKIKRRADNKQADESSAPVSEHQGEHIFAMDIGTRSVIGLIGRMTGDTLKIDAVAAEEHQNRAVVDGQIEDIAETAKIARKVKERLEREIGHSLSQVYIAAAGRVLKTGEAVHEAEIPENQEIDAPLVAKMEFAAIQSIHESLMKEEADHEDSFLCVGHSVVRYTLDDYDFSSLIGHKGGRAAVKVIATFLPREVVESLSTTMDRIGLTVAGLTLEPIAAINAVIPTDIRKLNLALVDIGAGTADIAICEKGSVSAYTMVTVAGDEITEAIMEACLADFKTSEELKRRLGGGEPFTYENILGFAVETAGDALYREIKPAVDHLVGVISEKITGINKKPPAAVFLVGGGSRLPGLSAMVAQALDMEENRVVVGGSANMRKQVSSGDDIFGPEFATPLGIAITAVQREKDESFTVTVNRERVPMLGVWEMTVLDALQLAGYKYSQIMGKAGRSLIYDLDGERRSLRGGLPGPSAISINGRTCTLGDMVTPGDQLLFEPAAPGNDALLTVEEAAGKQDPVPVIVNGVNYPAGYIALVNGRPASPGQNIRSMDVIRHKTIFTVGDLCDDLGIDLDMYEIFINGQGEADDYILMDGDMVETRFADEQMFLAAAAAPQPAVQTQVAPQAAASQEAVRTQVAQPQAASQAEASQPAMAEVKAPVEARQAASGLFRNEQLRRRQQEEQPQPPRRSQQDEQQPPPSPPRQQQEQTLPPSPSPPRQQQELPQPSPPRQQQEQTLPPPSLPRQQQPAAAKPAEASPPAPEANELLVYLNGEAIHLKPKEDGMPHCFVDMFSFAKIDTKNPHGDLIQTVNGREAPYMLELKNGDEVRIHWSEDTIL